MTCLVSLISCSSDIPPLQDHQSGILKHDPREISDEIFNYLKNIFSGSDGPPTQPPPVIEEEVLLDESSVGPAAQDDNSSDEPGIQNGIPLVDLEFTLTMSTVLMLVLSHPSLGLVVRLMMILQAFLRKSSLLLRCPPLSML